tara:strand:- start:1094 stop:2263 length:1170 start_codon:yes stop_codon:yes gene_type:complete
MGFKYSNKLKVKKKINLAILLNENYDIRNKYYKTFENLKKKFSIYFFIIQFKKTKKINNKKIYYADNYSKIKLIIKKLKFKFFIDGLYYADTKNHNKYYLSIIKKNHELRSIFRESGAKSLRFSFANLSKWNHFPYEIFTSIKFYLKKIKEKSLPRWLRNIHSHYLIAQGNFLPHYLNYKKSKIIYSHSIDFDNYLRSKDKKVLIKNYAVYIDQMIGEHPDNKIKSNIIKINAHFNKELLNFFNELEKKFKLNIKIAPHPKRKIKKKKIYERKVNFKDNTYNLIKNSKLVLCHDSAAVALAVLFKKPIIFLTSNSIKNRKYLDRIYEYSNFFNQETFNISKQFYFFSKKKIFSYDVNAYKKYTDNFLKHPKSKKETISQQIIRELKKFK